MEEKPLGGRLDPPSPLGKRRVKFLSKVSHYDFSSEGGMWISFQTFSQRDYKNYTAKGPCEAVVQIFYRGITKTILQKDPVKLLC